MENTVKGTIVTSEGMSLRLVSYGNKIIRVTYAAGPSFPDAASAIVTAAPDSGATVCENENELVFCAGDARAVVDKKTLDVKFERENYGILSRISGQGLDEYDIYRNEIKETKTRITADGVRITATDSERKFSRKACHGSLKLRFTEDEELYGLGSHEEGYPSLKGRYVPLYQENMRISLPYIVSTNGYAYLFDCLSFMIFDGTDRRHGNFYFDTVDALDYYFICGDGFDDVCRGYRHLTGITPLPPKWTVGYIQSKERYKTQEEIVGIAVKYREIGVPLDCVVQDWYTWPGDLWGYKIFDGERYPDPGKMTDDLHNMNVRMMISIWPYMIGDSENQKEFRAAGLLLGDDSTYDAFSPEGRDMYWKQAYDGIFRYNIDGWWCDSTEPFDAVWEGAERPPLPERMKKSVDEFKKYLDDGVINAYSLYHSMGIYEHQRVTGCKKRVVNLTRSGYPGQHRYGTFVWSGDVSATWEALARQVRIAQNYIACGEAYWNSDIGGFFVKKWRQWFGDGDYEKGCDDPGFRELYTRWLQFAGFTPMMRSHGTDTPREVWCFGERGTPFRDAIEKTIRLRYMLSAYFYSVCANVTFDGTMPITALGLAFPSDRTARAVDWEYIYGHEFLVCPVTHPEYYLPDSVEITNQDRYTDVYLPEGGWYDFHSEKYYDGGRYIRVANRIDRIPLFVRAGSIIPVMPVMQFVDEDPDAECEIRIYAGRDGEFELYNDAGDGYDYENGDYTRIRIKYSDSDGSVSEELSGVGSYRRRHRYRIIKKKGSD